MSEELKKALTLPVNLVFGVLSAILVIYGVIVFFESTLVRFSVISFIFFIIAIATIILLYRLVKRIERDNKSLKENNDGLIEVKDKYLDEKIQLEDELEKCLDEKIQLEGEYFRLKELLRTMIVQTQMKNIDLEQGELIAEYILGGKDNERKELESYKDN